MNFGQENKVMMMVMVMMAVELMTEFHVCNNECPDYLLTFHDE